MTFLIFLSQLIRLFDDFGLSLFYRGELFLYFSFDFDGDGLRYEIADFMYRVQGHPDREFKLTPEESICMAEIFETFLKQR